MKAWEMLILCVIIGLKAVPVISAKEAYAENSNTNVILDSDGKDYIASSSTENFLIQKTLFFLNGQPSQ